jgi:hypothetical protein
VQEFQGEHLGELVEALEADGRVTAAKINAAAKAIVQAFAERERIAREISAVASQVGRIHPGDVSDTNAFCAAAAQTSACASKATRLHSRLTTP